MRIERLLAAVARAHWRVVRATLRRESVPLVDDPINIEVDGVVDPVDRAEEKAKKALKIGACYAKVSLGDKPRG